MESLLGLLCCQSGGSRRVSHPLDLLTLGLAKNPKGHKIWSLFCLIVNASMQLYGSMWILTKRKEGNYLWRTGRLVLAGCMLSLDPEGRVCHLQKLNLYPRKTMMGTRHVDGALGIVPNNDCYNDSKEIFVTMIEHTKLEMSSFYP
jgi:hypothetical protein